ncbi:MAG: DUF3098 domain-containing protein [Bacteroidetes bacterium]|nr:DUF3098 domain-containing protein [Bacteroidota bacterium]
MKETRKNEKKPVKAPAKEKKGADFKVAKAGEFAFDRQNYILLLAGLFFIILGFILMIGGGSKDPNVFNEDIFSFRRLTLAPILILAGFVIEIFAIMKKPRD